MFGSSVHLQVVFDQSNDAFKVVRGASVQKRQQVVVVFSRLTKQGVESDGRVTSLLGDELQLRLLLVFLGQLSQAGQGGVHFLDGQEAFGGRREGFTGFEEHPDSF